MVGLLGLIPIYLGIRFAIVGEGEEEEEEIIERFEQSKANQLFWTVTLLTIASGGDNLGIYIPYFASLDWSQTLVALLVFAIGIIIFCELSRVLSSMPLISETIEKYERIVVPLVFILLGLYIMYENGTIEPTIFGSSPCLETFYPARMEPSEFRGLFCCLFLIEQDPSF